jgi:hypothetical protein
MRKAPSFLLLSVAVPALTALPVLSPPVAKPQPVTPEVRAVALAGVDDASLRSSAGAASEEVSAEARSDVLAPSQRGRAPSRPAVFTKARGAADFELLGVTWRAGTTADLTVLVRTHGESGWTEWTALDPAPTPDKSEGSDVRAGTEPLYAGPSDGYQVRIDVRTGTLPADVRVDLVDPGKSRADATVGAGAPMASAAAATAQPQILTRAQWGADESLRDGSPSYSSTIKAGFVHHTASANGYSAAEVPRILRGIYAYHTQSNGWSDIGYNFLVDRFGRLWEGRYGGIDKPVLGAHTGGFNTDTFAVSAIGNYDKVAAPAAMTAAITKVMGWKLSLHHRDPNGTTTLTSSGGGTSRYAAGTKVSTRVISAHRNMGYTSCPGKNLYAKMSTIRSTVAAGIGVSLINPAVVPTVIAYGKGTPVSITAAQYQYPNATRWSVQITDRLTGLPVRRIVGSGSVNAVWDGHNVTGQLARPGVYDVVIDAWYGSQQSFPYQGVVSVTAPSGVQVLRDANSALQWSQASDNTTTGITTFAYGTAKTIGVVGDWDGDGDTTPGVVDIVDGAWRWRLKDDNGGGAPDYTFTYGLAATCAPTTGDWNGDGRTTPGLICTQNRQLRWRLSNANAAGSPQYDFTFGLQTDLGLVGDWDGDGKDTVAAVRTSIEGGFSWALRNALSAGSPSARPQYGCVCGAAVAGDWDGDGSESIGVARGDSSQLRWQLKNANSAGSPDLMFYWGGGADRVMDGDWNGSGASRVGVRAPVAR